LTQCFDKVNNGVAVQPDGARENPVDCNNDRLGTGLPDALLDAGVERVEIQRRVVTVVVDEGGRRREEGGKRLGGGEDLRADAGADQLRQLQLRNTLDDVKPRAAQVVAVRVRNSDQDLDGVDVLGLHLRDGRVRSQQSEAGQRLHVGVPLEVHVEDARDANGAPDSVQAQGGNLRVITVLEIIFFLIHDPGYF
jgi:hypothetical protein